LFSDSFFFCLVTNKDASKCGTSFAVDIEQCDSD
jgi:hypothetical protein